MMAEFRGIHENSSSQPIPYVSVHTREWLRSQPLYTAPESPTSPVMPHSDRAQQLNQLYLEAKTSLVRARLQSVSETL